MPVIRTQDLLPFDAGDTETMKDALADAMASVSVGTTRAFVLTHLDENGECRATILGHPMVLDRMIQEMVSRIQWDLSEDAEGGVN